MKTVEQKARDLRDEIASIVTEYHRTIAWGEDTMLAIILRHFETEHDARQSAETELTLANQQVEKWKQRCDPQLDPLFRELEQLRAEVLRLKAVRDSEWKDKPDQWTEDIEKCHPENTDDHNRYMVALEMISNRNGKYELVNLVNWLLCKNDGYLKMASDAQHKYELLAGVKSSRWQPIESAPKDGSEILVNCADDHTGVLLVRWASASDFLTEQEIERQDIKDPFEKDWHYADFVSGGRLQEKPTHWMPVPKEQAA